MHVFIFCPIKKLKYLFSIQFNKLLILLYINKMTLHNNFDLMILVNINILFNKVKKAMLDSLYLIKNNLLI